MKAEDINALDFEKGGGLIPAIVQDAATRQVLMLGYMDRAAFTETLASGEATFFSRSRGGRWRKGESSGNRMVVRDVRRDCDGDALLVLVSPKGPACHLGAVSCFGDEPPADVWALRELEATIAGRAAAGDEQSYTVRLLAAGSKRIAQKVGEEGVECALAGAAGSEAELCEESADLLYHLVVLLHARGRALKDVCAVLARRARGQP